MIVGENLRELIKQHNIAPIDKFDGTCISLTLDNHIAQYEIPDGINVEYDSTSMEKYLKITKLGKSKGVVLKPQSCVLACSSEVIQMPNFCFGLLQTKGSLGRLFVFLNCADGQVDPGYHGKITFELFNAANFPVRVKPGQVVGNLYLFRTSTTAEEYNGRYQNAASPTYSKTK